LAAARGRSGAASGHRHGPFSEVVVTEFRRKVVAGSAEVGIGEGIAERVAGLYEGEEFRRCRRRGRWFSAPSGM
jgi:hypothetical protein